MPIFINSESPTKPNVIVAGRSGFYFAKRMYDFLVKEGIDDFRLMPMEKYDEEKKGIVPTHYDFADGTPHVELAENVRGRVNVVQCFDTPKYTSRDTLELYIMLDAIRRAHGESPTVILPYYPGRSDKKDEPRSEIFASMLAHDLEDRGCCGLMAMDLHSGQIQGYPKGPFDHLYGDPLFLLYLREMGISDYRNVVVASADAGGAKTSERFSELLTGNSEIAMMRKKRKRANEIEGSKFAGNVSGKVVIYREDIVDTGGTLVEATRQAYDAGAKRVIACVTQPLLSPKDGTTAEEKIVDCGLTIITTNTTPKGDRYFTECHPNIIVLDAAPMFAAALARNSKAKPVRSVLTEGYVNQLYEGSDYYSKAVDLSN